ncbi:chemotaxis signal transduction protein CheW [Clostridium aceticum]|uniref:Chemotaxis protein CheW n=1 Tax=Clostridium aceticum TaxID=84022 RepID=A0A0D8IFH0_9CLOT|nr:chemotaxis protein CheW [Clostridium aceticum]AKL94044.1 chemotaxis signal transduction protein CheW [Clostridium aceticum]KJF28762.1 chemotaxis protein CheW [Clostridium aceticum]
MAEKQYVIFKLCGEEYGVAIQHVQEITEHKRATTVPNVPKFIEGIINLRGNITPIISLKKKFNLQEGEIQESNRIIIINIADKQVGFIVDDASQVLTMDEKQIENPPELLTGIDRQYIIGIGKVEEKIIILLDLEKILTEKEKNEIKNM